MVASWQFALSVVLLLPSCAAGHAPVPQPDSTWHTYSNSEYAYEIRYPGECELHPTGSDSTKDGRTIRIRIRDRSAALERLDMQVYPRVPFTIAPPATKHVGVEVRDVMLNEVKSKLIEIRFKATGQLAEATLYREGVRFSYQAGVETRDFQKTVWWQIASSFRFLERK